MQRPAVDEYAPGYQKYFDLVPPGDFPTLLQLNSTETANFFNNIPDEKLDYRYAEGKWSVKEVLLHLIDTERVFSCRALAAARGDSSLHYRMDEELYSRNADVTQRSRESLIDEFNAVRKSTRLLLEQVTEAQSTLQCNIATHPMTTRAIGFFLIGHVLHHRSVVEQRYL